jgi:hypothetical protein
MAALREYNKFKPEQETQTTASFLPGATNATHNGADIRRSENLKSHWDKGSCIIVNATQVCRDSTYNAPNYFGARTKLNAPAINERDPAM